MVLKESRVNLIHLKAHRIDALRESFVFGLAARLPVLATALADAVHMYPEERPRWCAIDEPVRFHVLVVSPLN